MRRRPRLFAIDRNRKVESFGDASIAERRHCGCGMAGDERETTLGTADAGLEQRTQTRRVFPLPCREPHMNNRTKSQTILSKSASLTAFKFASGDSGAVTGYGSIFGNVDSYGQRVLPGAFAKSLTRHRAEGTRPLMLWQHNPGEPIGRWTEFVEDNVGLRLSGDFNLNTTKGRDAREHVKAGDVSGLSIGYYVIAERQNGLILELVELDLAEVSVVSFPANREARVGGVKFESLADIERVLRENGVTRGAAAKIAAGGWPALSGYPENDPSIKQLLTILKASRLELKGR
jgi:HK97 family phage prohead protease